MQLKKSIKKKIKDVQKEGRKTEKKYGAKASVGRLEKVSNLILKNVKQ